MFYIIHFVHLNSTQVNTIFDCFCMYVYKHEQYNLSTHSIRIDMCILIISEYCRHDKRSIPCTKGSQKPIVWPYFKPFWTRFFFLFFFSFLGISFWDRGSDRKSERQRQTEESEQRGRERQEKERRKRVANVCLKI